MIFIKRSSKINKFIIFTYMLRRFSFQLFSSPPIVPASQQKLLSKKLGQEFHDLCNSFLGRSAMNKNASSSVNQQQQQQQQQQNHQFSSAASSEALVKHLALVNKVSSTSSPSFIKGLDIRSIREICCKKLLRHQHQHQGGRKVPECTDTEALLMLASLMRDKIIFEIQDANNIIIDSVNNENNKNDDGDSSTKQKPSLPSSSATTTTTLSPQEKAKIKQANRNYLLSEAIHIAWAIRSVHITRGAPETHRREVKNFLSSILLLAEFVSKPHLDRLALMALSNSSSNQNPNPSPYYFAAQQIVNQFGGPHMLSKFICCIANDWIPLFENSDNNSNENSTTTANTKNSSQQHHNQPLSLSSKMSSAEILLLESLIKTGCLCWEFNQRKNLPYILRAESSSSNASAKKINNIESKRKNEKKGIIMMDPKKLYEDLLLLTVVMIRHSVMWKGMYRLSRYMICTVCVPDHVAKQRRRNYYEALMNNKNNNTSDDDIEKKLLSSSSSSSSSPLLKKGVFFPHKNEDRFYNELFEQNPNLLARLSYVIGAMNLMNGSLVRAVSELHFKLFILPPHSSSNHREKNQQHLHDEMLQQEEEEDNIKNSFKKSSDSSKSIKSTTGSAESRRDSQSIRRSIDIMKHKLSNSGIINKKLALAEVICSDILTFSHEGVMTGEDAADDLVTQQQGEGEGRTSSIKKSTVLFGNSGSDDVVSNDNNSNSSSSSSSSSSVDLAQRFPPLDPQLVVTTKQIDLKRSSLTASWGLLVEGNGHLRVPARLAVIGENKNPFYENVVAPTTQLGCVLRLMAIDGSPISCLGDVHQKLGGVVKVRLTLSVVKREDK